jgi:hypothetical protein
MIGFERERGDFFFILFFFLFACMVFLFWGVFLAGKKNVSAGLHGHILSLYG